MKRANAIPLVALAAALQAAPAAAQNAQTPPWSTEGRLEDGDRRDGASDDARFDEHRLRLEAGRRYRLSAGSDDFDTVIQLYQAGEPDPVAMNDDFNAAENLNSRITYEPEETAEYILRIVSFFDSGRGAYRASVETLPPLPAPVSGPGRQSAQTSWQIWEGELSAADPDRDGGYFDDYLVTMRAGETRLISAEAEAFDPTIWVLRADERGGEPRDIDEDRGPWSNALLGFQPEEDGDYIVRVIASGGGTGAYRLRISDPLTPPPPGPQAEPGEVSAD